MEKKIVKKIVLKDKQNEKEQINREPLKDPIKKEERGAKKETKNSNSKITREMLDGFVHYGKLVKNRIVYSMAPCELEFDLFIQMLPEEDRDKIKYEILNILKKHELYLLNLEPGTKKYKKEVIDILCVEFKL